MAETATTAATAAQTPTIPAFQRATEMHINVETPDGDLVPIAELVDESLPTLAAIGKLYEKKIADANGSSSYYVENNKASRKDMLISDAIKSLYDSKKYQAESAERKRKAQRNIEIAREQKEKALAIQLGKMNVEQLDGFIAEQDAIVNGEDF